MSERPVSVVELSTFIQSAEAAGMDEAERGELIDFLARNPLAGDLIRETGGVRKVRWKRPGAGKSGGFRAVYFFYDDDAPIYAILAYGKGDQADLNAAQRKAATAFVQALKAAIRSRRVGKVETK